MSKTMTEEYMEDQDSLNPEDEDQDSNPDETSDEFNEEETEEETSKEAEIAKNQKIRAEKAEAELKKLKNQQAQQAQQAEGEGTPKKDLSTEDLYALIDNKVPQEDITDVKEYAQFKGISVAEALKSSVVKSVLSEKAEARKVAQGTNTGTSKRGVSKTPSSTLLEKFKKGEIPESEEDMRRIAEARLKR